MSALEVRHVEDRDGSVAFHLDHGLREVGTFVGDARKWGRDVSSTWLQRHA